MKKRYPLRKLLELIDEPNRSACLRLYDENIELFKKAYGSKRNHQAWPGGYHDHLEEAGNFGNLLYDIAEGTGRALDFSRSDVQLVLFCHDLEKPWKYQFDSLGKIEVIPELRDKAAQHKFRFQKIGEYGIALNGMHVNGMYFVEGEREADYSEDEPASSPLAGLCHCADHFSARVHRNHPLKIDDPWWGAVRANSTL